MEVGNVNSGLNDGNTVQTGGGGSVDGGDTLNSTDVTGSADGGTAIADAEGGDDTVAIVDDAGCYWYYDWFWGVYVYVC